MSRSQTAAPAKAQVAQPAIVTWDDVKNQSGKAALNGYTLLPEGSKPSTAPDRVLESSPNSLWGRDVDDNHPVLLVRDTNAWCPYCERSGFLSVCLHMELETMNSSP